MGDTTMTAVMARTGANKVIVKDDSEITIQDSTGREWTLEELARALKPRVRKLCEVYVTGTGYNKAEAYRVVYGKQSVDKAADDYLDPHNCNVMAVKVMRAGGEMARLYIRALERSAARASGYTPETIAARVEHIMTSPDASPADRLRGCELLAKLSGFTGEKANNNTQVLIINGNVNNLGK